MEHERLVVQRGCRGPPVEDVRYLRQVLQFELEEVSAPDVQSGGSSSSSSKYVAILGVELGGYRSLGKLRATFCL